MSNARNDLRVLDAGAKPHIRRPVELIGMLGRNFGSLRQDLECVMRAGRHHLEDLLDERERHVHLEQVAHRVDEDQAR